MKLSYATKLLTLLAIGGSSVNGFHQVAHYRTPNNMLSTSPHTTSTRPSRSNSRPTNNNNNNSNAREMTTAGGSNQQLTPPNEVNAKAMSEYMAKAHEDKLRAIKEVETKKAEEIKALKEELETLKKVKEDEDKSFTSAIAPATAAPLVVAEGSVEELTQKLESYQNFMAKYIVEAQEQKLKAVKAAEAAVAQKYEQKLLLLGGGAATSDAAPPAVTMSKEQTLYASRNAKVAEAAKAGKSRWGAQEVARVSGGVQAAPAAVAPAAPATPVFSKNVELFNKRNANVVASAQAGMSRWGPMEVAKASGATTIVVPKNTASPPVANGVPVAAAAPAALTEVPPEVEAADHGLRADGGVGGLSLAERVVMGSQASITNIGATIIAQADIPPEVEAADHGLRADGGVGGLSLAERVVMGSQASITNIGATIIAQADIPPEVEAADHGLRADGGVGGLSLAERVVLGSQANGAASSKAVNVPVISQQHELFNKRNAHVAAAAKAGKSRWGPMEVAKALSTLSSNGSAAPAAVAASAKVNIGAQLLGA